MPPVQRRHMNAFEKALERFAQTKIGGFYFVKIGNRIDRPLLKLSRGRLSFAVGAPVLLLKHIGAKSGKTRETPLLYTKYDDAVIIVASNAGSTKHPAWYANLRKNPECEVIIPKRSGKWRAREVIDEAERERVWALVNDQYAGYETYQGRTDGRKIPLMVLDRA